MRDYNTQQNSGFAPPRWAVWLKLPNNDHECASHYHTEPMATMNRDRLLSEGLCAWIVDTWKNNESR